MARHDTIVRLLVRRYVTSEQRKRDQFGITEDDVREIRQDISSFRYDLFDILKNNGMRTPKLDKEETTIPGKKGRVMERRLQKDFQIGIVEGIVHAVIQSEKEPKDVFSQIARAIGRKGSGADRKDWNAVVRQSTIVKDPIGSTNEAVQRQSRRSIRRQLRHQPDSDLASMDPKRLVDYNPNLTEFTPTTRIAYAKFMMRKNKPEEQSNDTNGFSEVIEETVQIPRRSSKVIIVETSTDMVPQPATETLKKSVLKSTSSDSMDKPEEKVLHIKTTKTRSPSPIPEDPVEEDGKQSISLTMTDQKKKTEENNKREKEKVQEQQRKNDREASEGKKLDEQKKDEKAEDEDKRQQLGNTEGNNNDNDGGKILKTEYKENDKEKCAESDAKEKKPETASIQTTKLRGKSKATGQIMGGWI